MSLFLILKGLISKFVWPTNIGLSPNELWTFVFEKHEFFPTLRKILLFSKLWILLEVEEMKRSMNLLTTQFVSNGQEKLSKHISTRYRFIHFDVNLRIFKLSNLILFVKTQLGTDIQCYEWVDFYNFICQRPSLM